MVRGSRRPCASSPASCPPRAARLGSRGATCSASRWRSASGSATVRRTSRSSDLRVAPYLDFVAEVKGLGRTERRRQVAEVMERCLITEVQQLLIGRLSKGYRQRVGLAQAILGDPEVLILDEPTIGLDPKQITEIRSLIKSLAGRHTVILSTHILPEVSMVCGGVVIINKGSIVAQGRIDTLVDQFFPTARVEVEIVGPPAAVHSAMRGIPGVVAVQGVTVTDRAGRYVVEAARGRDVRAEIFALASQQRGRSEEHTSELQLPSNFVCRLLLARK